MKAGDKVWVVLPGETEPVQRTVCVQRAAYAGGSGRLAVLGRDRTKLGLNSAPHGTTAESALVDALEQTVQRRAYWARVVDDRKIALRKAAETFAAVESRAMAFARQLWELREKRKMVTCDAEVLADGELERLAAMEADALAEEVAPCDEP